MKKSMEGNNKGLHRLPENVLVEILSRLPLKTAIATVVLSRRWRWLWTYVTGIDIDVTNYPAYAAHNCPHGVANQLSFVQNNILPKLESPFFRSLSFNLRFPHWYDYSGDGYDYYDDIVSWYDWAWRRRNGLEKLRVTFGLYCPGRLPGTPLWIFQTPSLEVLELDPWWFEDYYDNDEYRNLSFHLPNLKKVCVCLHSSSVWILEKLVSSSPSLEILSCTISSWTLTDNVYLSSRNLKRLEMSLFQPTRVVIDAPKLKYLSIHAYKESVSNKISFVNSTPALLNCSILPWKNQKGTDTFLPSNLCDVISGVRTLTTAAQNPISSITSITFRCLTHLQLRVCFSSELRGLDLLQQCPVLEVLSFDLSQYLYTTKHQFWSLPKSVPQCLVTRVKRIEILARHFDFELEKILLQLLNYLLGNAMALKLVRVMREETDCTSASYDEIHLIKQLFRVYRTSAHSRVEFYSPNHVVLDNAEATNLVSLFPYVSYLLT